MKEKKIIEIDLETTKLCFKCLKWTYGRSNIDYRVASLFTGYSDLESPSNLQVKEKKILKSIQKQRNYALIKNSKIVMFKMDGRTFQYRVAFHMVANC